jgi:Asp/Glu/hydantoin racemase
VLSFGVGQSETAGLAITLAAAFVIPVRAGLLGKGEIAAGLVKRETGRDFQGTSFLRTS